MMISRLLSNKKIQITIFLLVFITVSSFYVTQVYADDDDEDDDDFGKDLGNVAIGLFAFSTVNIIALYIFRISRKLLGEDEKNLERKKKITNIYQKIRKPLKYIHYVSGLAAVTVLLIHGINLSSSDDFGIIIGWVTAGVYLLYVLTGLLIWLKVKPFWSSNKAKKILNKFHRSLILFLGVIIVHIVHVVVVD